MARSYDPQRGQRTWPRKAGREADRAATMDPGARARPEPRKDEGETMAKVDVWATVHAERAALAADLDGIDDQQWAAQSLCGQWTVRDVLAHMTATAKISPPLFIAKMAGSSARPAPLGRCSDNLPRRTVPTR